MKWFFIYWRERMKYLNDFILLICRWNRWRGYGWRRWRGLWRRGGRGDIFINPYDSGHKLTLLSVNPVKKGGWVISLALQISKWANKVKLKHKLNDRLLFKTIKDGYDVAPCRWLWLITITITKKVVPNNYHNKERVAQ